MSLDQSHSVGKTTSPVNSLANHVNLPRDTEVSLHESELKYQRLVEGIGGDYVLYTHDPEGIITYVSPSIESVLGFPVKAVMGLNWRDLIGEHFVGRDIAERVTDEVAAGKNFYCFTVEMSHAGGGTLLVEIQQRPLFDANGRYLSMEGIAKDITEATRNAEELQKLKQELEQRVADRTAELILSNDRLREKEAHLAHVSRLTTMCELVAGLAHEIHQPLHAAKTFAEVARRNLELSKGNLDRKAADNNVEKAVDCTREISDAITRAATIIRRLREFTHSRPVEFDQFDLNQVAREACELIVFETRKAQVKLDFELAEIPRIQGDSIQLQQVCVNLLMNAYEAMEETPIEERRVLISTWHDASHVYLEFWDAGCGIAEEERGKLFNAFYSTKQQGMGMGLSLCKSIAEAHGGKVEGNGNEDSGMTFTLKLPIRRRPPYKRSKDNLANE